MKAGRGEWVATRLSNQASKGHAARDLDALGVDPAIVVGKQRGDHRADVVGLADAAERRHVRDVLVHLRIVADHAAAEIGRDGARCDDVDGDPARPELLRQVAVSTSIAPFIGRIRRRCPA